ncbi:MAG: carbohydrate binding family 9 domain-containing protein [Cyclobacteriaceae bacterium]|nr:carbohydrate binding family 9 domain-containing protein [Cyclobacteriaceae bacterium]
MKFLVQLVIIIFLGIPVYAQKSLNALRIEKPVKVDGKLDEEMWLIADKASEFIQRSPRPGKNPSQKTEVSILYNNAYIYIGAWLYDDHPERIMTELNGRDQGGNADQFTLHFDTYKDGLNAFEFAVSASGVQLDSRISPGNYDRNWDGGWYSEVVINEEGWFVEIEIPLSVLRFPSTEKQEWGLNFRRLIRRDNESLYWNEINPKISGFVNQFGILTGIEGIKTPLRLSITPYFSSYINRHYDAETQNASIMTNFRGGMDLKYGINDAFTLDMMLVPDFGQVVSDNNVLNLGPYEVYNQERRQFFVEGTDLFEKAGLLYSRRIGGKPIDYDLSEEQLSGGDEIISNPLESQIINAAKVSGRTRSGLGIGFLNALTGRTHAVIRTPEGEEKEIQTSPIINYNVFVLDQSLKNNSYINFTNTNVTRAENYYDANVIGTNFRFSDKSNNYAAGGRANISHLYGYTDVENNTSGFNTNFWAGKTGGNFLYRIGNNLESDQYQPNDLGFNRSPNNNNSYLNFEYREYEPFFKFLDFSAEVGVNYRRRYLPNVFTSLSIETSVHATFTNFLSTRVWFEFSPVEQKDFDETRTVKRFIYEPEYHSSGFSLNTDSRKKVMLSGWGYYYQTSQEGRNYVSFTLSPRLRINNQLSISTSLSGSNSHNNIGYVSNIEEDIHFGLRDVKSFTNILTTKFTFNKEMDLYLRMRHYWSSAKYDDYYLLGNDGRLEPTDYNDMHDVNFNSFNIDMIYRWIFSPASELSIVWKSSALNSTDQVLYNYFDNFSNTFDANRDNSISLKILYYLDYLMLTRSRNTI